MRASVGCRVSALTQIRLKNELKMNHPRTKGDARWAGFVSAPTLTNDGGRNESFHWSCSKYIAFYQITARPFARENHNPTRLGRLYG